jgi:hypothetical protein
MITLGKLIYDPARPRFEAEADGQSITIELSSSAVIRLCEGRRDQLDCLEAARGRVRSAAERLRQGGFVIENHPATPTIIITALDLD